MSLFAPAPPPPTSLGRYRILSSHAGVRVSPLQLGAMSIGDQWAMAGTMSKETAFDLLDTFVAAGGNFIDTANNYQYERSEKWLGEWMTERNNRDLLVLATKFTTQYRSHELGPGKSVNYCGNHAKSIHMSVAASLKKLQTTYIDILYLHWWDYTTSIKEVMDTLHTLVLQGKVLYLGISDTPAWVVSAANTYAIDNGKTPFCIYQGRWNVMRRDFERDIIPMARQFGLALAPWDVVGGGKFKTKEEVERRMKSAEGLRSRAGVFGQPVITEEEAKMTEALLKVGSEHGIDSPTAVAIAYVMAKAPNVFPIVGVRSKEQLESNIKALDIILTKEQIEYLEGVFNFDKGFPLDMIGDDPRSTGVPGILVGSSAPMAYNKNFRAIGYEDL
ncbi:NADP-dependent oxidoreductase domain-containing protein [Lipomyces oligophaga]|uniref:NADP-dependent oxidoreductase domain-containing protein n=1 Tax=Lipomyces oligophaga TaxID=45792 RepID=UPI0034CEA078